MAPINLTKTYTTDTTRYEPKDLKTEPNTIYQMARKAGPGVDHLFYLYTDSHGNKYTVSGFPKLDRSKVFGASEANVLTGGGGWGPIVIRNGKDNFPATKLARFSSPTNNPADVAKAWQLLQREHRVIEGEQIPYRLNGYNSNSVNTTAGRNWSNDVNINEIGSQPERKDINVPGAQYDQIVPWNPLTEKSNDKNSKTDDTKINYESPSLTNPNSTGTNSHLRYIYTDNTSSNNLDKTATDNQMTENDKWTEQIKLSQVQSNIIAFQSLNNGMPEKDNSNSANLWTDSLTNLKEMTEKNNDKKSTEPGLTQKAAQTTELQR
jgi:hypothetical protein